MVNIPLFRNIATVRYVRNIRKLLIFYADVSKLMFFESGKIPLSCRLIKQQSGRSSHIEGINFAQHRNHYLQIGSVHPEIGEACLFCSDDYGNSLRQIDVGIAVDGVRSRGKRADVVLFEPLFCRLIVALGKRNREYGSRACAYHVGIIDICTLFSDDNSCRIDGICTAEH